MSERKELLAGCGAKREKMVAWEATPSLAGIAKEWNGLVTLDMSERHKPDVVHDLNVLPWPFPDNYFDECHFYEVLEHIGQQGDFVSFFAHFSEIWRILKPDGYLVGSCPMWDGLWAWSDPGHRRIISQGSLTFLQQSFYEEQVGKTPATDYRDIYKADFRLIDFKERSGSFFFAIQAVK